MFKLISPILPILNCLRTAPLPLALFITSCSDSTQPTDSAQEAKIPPATPSAVAPETSGPFSFGSKDKVLVQWKGKPLIENEDLNYIDKANLSEGAEITQSSIGEFQVKNIRSSDEQISYRSEIGISPDEVEFTTEFYLPIYKNDPAKPSIMYGFSVPLSTLGEANFTAYVGRTSLPKTIEGKIFPGMPAGDLLKKYKLSSARWITFHTKQGDLTFDLHPKGVTAYSDFGPGDLIGNRKISIKNDSLYFQFGGRAPLYGGIYASKLRIFEGGIEEFKNRHFHKQYRYFSETPVSARYLFGGQPRNKFDTIIKPTSLASDSTPGWLGDTKINKTRYSGGTPFRFGAASDKATDFRFFIEQPGIYIITLHSVFGNEDAKPFQIGINDRSLLPADLENPESDSVQSVTFAEYLEPGANTLHFSGDWQVSSIVIQPLLHEKEDFIIRRGIWLDENLPEVTEVNRNRNKDPLNWRVAIERKKLNEPSDFSAHTPKRIPWEAKHPDPKGLEWRYEALISTIGPNNWGTFTEFTTREAIARRLDELKAQGITLIQINGFLARHLWLDQKDRVWEQIKIITEEAHKRDMKVADHLDVTILWNRGQGHRYLIENIDTLLRSYEGDTPHWGINILNPRFKKWFFQEMVDLVKETDIDGLMLDEVNFHLGKFDFSKATREQFTKDTGLVMPYNESSRVFKNRDSSLWKTWLNWRSKVVARWFGELRESIEAVKPNFVLMRYTTEGGISSPSVFSEQSAALDDTAMTVDMIGTEIMSRNILETHRSGYFYRKVKDAFRSLADFPVFGLIYTSNPEVLEFGWGLLNMNRQTAWIFGGDTFTKEQTPYIAWEDNMDLVNARPIADIAMVYSLATRNWVRGKKHHYELGGISQTLTENHIPHDIIFDEALRKNVPSKYKLLILANNAAISDAEIKTLIDYTEKGGHLLIVGDAGTQNELAEPREKSLIQQLRKLANQADDASEFTLGKGRIYYSAEALGNNNFEESKKLNVPRAFARDTAQEKKCLELVAAAHGDTPLPYKVVSAPAALYTAAFTQPNGEKETHVFHFLNASGAKVKDGEIITANPVGEAFPKITEDAVIEADWQGPASAYIVHPRSKEKHPLAVERLSNTRVRFTVPAEFLNRYSLVFVEPEESK